MTNEKPEIKLLPCPFCGAKASVKGTQNKKRVWIDAACKKTCPCEPSTIIGPIDEIVAAWNTREGK